MARRVTVPPPLSTLSAVTELFVTAAVFYFFYQALRHANYRWGLMTVAIVYETLFNITYMVSRLIVHEEGATHQHPGWVTGFVAFHGSLSLVMFLGLIGFVVWAWRRVRAGEPDPIGARRSLSYGFLVLWTISILTGEAIYLMYWTGVIEA